MNVRVIEIDGTYAVTVNGEVVAAGLSDAQAWREADRAPEISPRASESASQHPSVSLRAGSLVAAKER
jgi:hypothetical protein